MTWSGGNPSGYVIIQASASTFDNLATAGFVCTERVAAGQFTIPPEVMLSLPADPAGRPLPISAISPVTTTFKRPGWIRTVLVLFGGAVEVRAGRGAILIPMRGSCSSLRPRPLLLAQKPWREYPAFEYNTSRSRPITRRRPNWFSRA